MKTFLYSTGVNAGRKASYLKIVWLVDRLYVWWDIPNHLMDTSKTFLIFLPVREFFKKQNSKFLNKLN